MAFVPVPKDLNRVKTKVMFNLTKRQLICFSIAAAVGVPIFFLAKAHLDLSTAAMLMVVIMLPFIFFALYEKDGQPAEKYLYHIVQSMFIRDKVRPYRTNNLYAEIQQKIKEQEELQLEQQHSKGKAYLHLQYLRIICWLPACPHFYFIIASVPNTGLIFVSTAKPRHHHL